MMIQILLFSLGLAVGFGIGVWSTLKYVNKSSGRE